MKTNLNLQVNFYNGWWGHQPLSKNFYNGWWGHQPLSKPKFHICGHIHEAYGMQEKDGTTFINASVLNERYVLVNEPIVFDL